MSAKSSNHSQMGRGQCPRFSCSTLTRPLSRCSSLLQSSCVPRQPAQTGRLFSPCCSAHKSSCRGGCVLHSHMYKVAPLNHAFGLVGASPAVLVSGLLCLLAAGSSIFFELAKRSSIKPLLLGTASFRPAAGFFCTPGDFT